MADLLLRGWEALASIPGLGLALALGWLAYLVLLGGWIVLQKREPVATLSWLLGLALLPYVGFLIYHVFGPQKIHRHRLRRETSRARMAKDADYSDETTETAELTRLAEASTGLARSRASDVRLLIDGCATYDALLEDVRAAQVGRPVPQGRLLPPGVVAHRVVLADHEQGRDLDAPVLQPGGERPIAVEAAVPVQRTLEAAGGEGRDILGEMVRAHPRRQGRGVGFLGDASPEGQATAGSRRRDRSPLPSASCPGTRPAPQCATCRIPPCCNRPAP